MGFLSSIFKSIVETATSGNSDKVYTFNFAGYYDWPNFRNCFNGKGYASDGKWLIMQVCAFGLMRLIQENELAEYKDDYISVIADRNYHAAHIAQCIQEGKQIYGVVREIVKFIDLVFSGDQLVRATLQVEADSGHMVTMRVNFPGELFQVSKYSLSNCQYIPGFRLPSNY